MGNKIKLGDKVRDIYSGMEGTAMSKTEFLNGCIQFSVLQKLKKGERLKSVEDIMEVSIDEGNLEIIKPKKKKVVKKKESNGGPYRMAPKIGKY